MGVKIWDNDDLRQAKRAGYNQALEDFELFINELEDLPYCWVDTICDKIEELKKSEAQE